MRMRKKKNLSDRMDKCGDYLLKVDSVNFNPNDKEVVISYIDFAEVFKNDNPLILEIGCGKGKFISEMAQLHPEYNFLGVEICDNVIITACETAVKKDIPNVRFMNCGAEYLMRFIKQNSVSLIYLNFSSPYPKNPNANRRLTHPRFLNIYKELLVENGEIHQKTDNRDFFTYSIEQFSCNGFGVKNITLDLHSTDTPNIMTEYEMRWAAEGKPIYRLEAILKE